MFYDHNLIVSMDAADLRRIARQHLAGSKQIVMQEIETQSLQIVVWFHYRKFAPQSYVGRLGRFPVLLLPPGFVKSLSRRDSEVFAFFAA